MSSVFHSGPILIKQKGIGPMRNDLCKCGNTKKITSKQCLKCYLEGYKNKTEKLCRGCLQVLPIKEFRKKLDAIRPRSRCKKCEADFARKWRKENPEEHKRRKRQWAINNPEKAKRSLMRRIWKRKGLNPDQVEEYIKTHPNVCEICGQPDDYQALSVDHSHDKKVFRGLLCSKCNMGIGLFQDNPQLLQKAIEYLIRTRPSFPNIPAQSLDLCSQL